MMFFHFQTDFFPFWEDLEQLFMQLSWWLWITT